MTTLEMTREGLLNPDGTAAAMTLGQLVGTKPLKPAFPRNVVRRCSCGAALNHFHKGKKCYSCLSKH